MGMMPGEALSLNGAPCNIRAGRGNNIRELYLYFSLFCSKGSLEAQTRQTRTLEDDDVTPHPNSPTYPFEQKMSGSS